MCGAPVQDLSLEGIDVATETVIQGTVTRDGQPEGGAYVRLLDSSGEFTAEVVTSATGAFRFFARPGTGRVRARAGGDKTADAQVAAKQGAATETTTPLSPPRHKGGVAREKTRTTRHCRGVARGGRLP